MRRFVLIIIALMTLAGVGYWALDLDSQGPQEPSRDDVSRTSGTPTETPLRSSRLPGARVSGQVVREGHPVANARVSLRSTTSLVTQSLDDGRFLFDDLPSGPVYLAASTADAASEVVGPFQLVPSGHVEDVTLVLLPSVRIEVRIVDLLTQHPVSGATVVTPTVVGRSDEAGLVSIHAPQRQTWIEVSAPGFLSRTEWVSLELAASGGKLELVLTPASRIEGSVLESGVPSAAATVFGEVAEGARRSERSANAFTDKAGHFVLECAAGLLQLSSVTPRGTRIRGPLVRVSVGEKKAGVILESGDVSSAEGQVLRSGLPVVGAQVSAIEAQNEVINGLATTGLDGRFRFEGLALGHYVLQVRSGDLSSVAGPFDHRGDGQSWTVGLAEGGVVVGRVEPAGPGVSVRWRSGSWSGPPAQAVTDATGHFRLEGLPVEWGSLDADGPEGAATARAKAGDDVVLVLKKGVVTLHLKDGAGQPVSDGVIIAKSLETGATRRQLVLAPDGVAQISLPSGLWELALEVTGRGRSPGMSVTVDARGAEAQLTLEPVVLVSGKVTENATGLPIVGARVEAISGEFGRSSRVSVLTDARGVYLLPPVPKSASLSASHSGLVTQWRRASDGPRWDVALGRPSPEQQRSMPPEFTQFEGVGMTLDGRSGVVLVTVVSEGSPAERAGIQAGDQILAVDGSAIAGQPIEAVVQRIRGPAGTPVMLRIQRQGQVFELTLRRRLLTL